MACVTAPSHHLSQCSLIISEVHWQSPAISQYIPQLSVTKSSLKMPYQKFLWNLPGNNELIYGLVFHENGFQLPKKWPEMQMYFSVSKHKISKWSFNLMNFMMDLFLFVFRFWAFYLHLRLGPNIIGTKLTQVGKLLLVLLELNFMRKFEKKNTFNIIFVAPKHCRFLNFTSPKDKNICIIHSSLSLLLIIWWLNEPEH